jgi:hypothetical protein
LLGGYGIVTSARIRTSANQTLTSEHINTIIEDFPDIYTGIADCLTMTAPPVSINFVVPESPPVLPGCCRNATDSSFAARPLPSVSNPQIQLLLLRVSPQLPPPPLTARQKVLSLGQRRKRTDVRGPVRMMREAIATSMNFI